MSKEMLDRTRNAGIRLWEVQRMQRTHLCCGIDLHFDANAPYDAAFYTVVARESTPRSMKIMAAVCQIVDAQSPALFPGIVTPPDEEFYLFAVGMIEYWLRVIEAQWACGIRVFKPQIAFIERLAPLAHYALETITSMIHFLGRTQNEPYFIILDAKRGDIASTQLPYYATYLSCHDEEVLPGLCGRFDVDAITVTTWMGTDVLTPGLPWFKRGKGAVVVNTSSNPSGYEIQSHTGGDWHTAAQAMLEDTERFSVSHDLTEDLVSPIFSVMGATQVFDCAFRSLRPSGTALIPGFGAQGGDFANVMSLVQTQGPNKGQLGICSSSRAHGFPWMAKYGGSGDIRGTLLDEMFRAVSSFRRAERDAYNEAGIDWPF